MRSRDNVRSRPVFAALALSAQHLRWHVWCSASPPMSTIKTKDGTQLFYKDWGAGQPIVFSHGWPLSADAFEDQMMYLASRGYRCIAHDRRGHGRSDQCSTRSARRS